MNNILINPGKNNVGAYIENIDLKKLDKNQISEIKDALNNFGVVFVKSLILFPWPAAKIKISIMRSFL